MQKKRITSIRKTQSNWNCSCDLLEIRYSDRTKETMCFEDAPEEIKSLMNRPYDKLLTSDREPVFVYLFRKSTTR